MNVFYTYSMYVLFFFEERAENQGLLLYFSRRLCEQI